MNKSKPKIHHRRSIRLKGYDYSQPGLYFITICCHNREHLFGEIVTTKNDSSDNKMPVMELNNAGKMTRDCWKNIPDHFPNVVLHEYIIMPNHVHGIIELVGANQHSPNQHSPNQHLSGTGKNNNPTIENNETKNVSNGAGNVPNGAKNISPPRSPSKTIGSVVRGFKIGVTKWMRQNTDIFDVWQRNYYEHIIRNEKSYGNISQYIISNPEKWEDDKFHT